MSAPALIIDSLHFGYTADRPVLRGVDLIADRGELVSILGQNGAGKSTLFRCILGLIRHYQGSVRIDAKEGKTISPKELASKVAYIPQSHYSSFNYSVLDMVLMGSAGALSAAQNPGRKEEARAREALERVGMLKLCDQGFAQISGGEQQLVLMARAIVQNADIWVLDEPLASLDYGNQIRVLTQLKNMASNGYLILQSIHNPDQAYRYSDRIIALKDGTVLACGKPSEVMDEALLKEIYGDDISWKYPEARTGSGERKK